MPISVPTRDIGCEGGVTGLLAFGVWIVAVVLTVPFLVLVIFFVGAGRLWGWVRNLSILERARARAKARALHRRLGGLLARKRLPTRDTFAADMRTTLSGSYPDLSPRILDVLAACARSLYEAEGLGTDLPIPAIKNELDAARYHDEILRRIGQLTDANAVSKFRTAVLGLLEAFCNRLPPIAKMAMQSEDQSLSVRLIDVLPSVPQVIEDLTKSCNTAAVEYDLLSALCDRLRRNVHKVSGVPYPPQRRGAPKLIQPTDFKGPPDVAVRGYLEGTPFEALFDASIPFELPDAVRFEHQWIVAGSGHGKTQCLQYQIARDLPRVARGECSVIVIDSQGDLIRNIMGLKLFAPGQPLFDKLVLIDPTDVEYPVALNLFDAGQQRLDRYSPLDRERLQNSIVELYDFVLGSLLSAELTQKQSVIFRFITRLMLQIPGATINTFRELMEPHGFEKYLSYVTQLDGTARAFFETEFNSKQFEDTKRQVLRRLWGVLENRTFERMFSQPKSKLDLFAEMNAGKVILINTAKDLLKETGTEVFGRFFIALIAQAAQERATLPEHARTPCLCVIDEASEYFDENVSTILETARKQKISLCCANQYVGQLSPKLHESFAANTSIKFVGGVSDKDARAFSHILRCSPEFILDQPKGCFSAFVRNFTQSAVSLRIPFGYLEAMPRMDGAEENAVRKRTREKYAVNWAAAFEESSNTKGDLPIAIVDPTVPGEW